MTASTSHSNPVMQEWLALRQEPVLDPGRPIVDAHHHLWDRPGWPYLFSDFLEDVGTGHNIVSSVYVQARSMYRASGPAEMRPIGEVEFVNGVAAMSASGLYGPARLCAGIVAYADLTSGGRVEQVLNALMHAGGDRLRGIRHITAWDPDASLLNPAYPTTSSMMNERSFREGFATLAHLGLSFDAWLYHPQIDDLRNLASDFANVTIILNHAGGPIGTGNYCNHREEVFAKWASSIRELAKCPNVYVKIGGLGQAINGLGLNEHELPPTSDELAMVMRPFAETCIDAFGPERAMFESNFPVDKASYSYSVFWNACKRLVQDMSESEKDQLFSQTAIRCYRLDYAC